MSSTSCRCGRMRIALCGVLVLAFAVRVHADPKPLKKEEQAKVDKAVDKAVGYLKRMQTEEGDWFRLGKPEFGGKNYIIGQSLLAAYALLEADVLTDDPVIKKAANYIRAKLPKTDKTYELSLGVLFLDRLGDRRDKKLLRTLVLRLIAGQHRTGGWSYSCPRVKDENEESFLKLLGEVTALAEAGKKPNAEWLKGLRVPPALQSLTVFQIPEELSKDDLPARRAKKAEEPKLGEISNYSGSTDNSNTQFALLALWTAQRHQFPVRPTLDLVVQRFERTQAADGWWPYTYQGHPTIGASTSTQYRSMTCVGLVALAIGHGLKGIPPSPSSREAEEIRIRNIRILKGLADLYRRIGVPARRLGKHLDNGDYYFLWSLERVAMLYNLPTLGDREWYRWGIEILVPNQKRGGGFPEPRKGFDEQGSTVNTAFALLFLKRSHPLKDLTPKLLLKTAELNKSILRPLRKYDTLDRPTLSPGQSRSLDRSITSPGQNGKSDR